MSYAEKPMLHSIDKLCSHNAVLHEKFLRPNEERNIYFPLIGESGFIQMATIINAESEILINEEIVLKDRSYKLHKHREFYILTGKL